MKALIAVLIVTAVLGIQACTSTNTPRAEDAPALSGPVGEAVMVTVRGWIDAIDKTNRTVTLKGPRGGTVTLDVKDPTKLDTVAVGDPVVAAFIEALALQVKTVPGATPGVSVTEARIASQPGETPSGAVGREVVVTATIAAVDRKAQTVTIQGPRGNTETIKVKDATNLKGVEAGDVAELTYTQALAVTLDRAGQ
jgi:Cu/Ag efflux protein CusF